MLLSRFIHSEGMLVRTGLYRQTCTFEAQVFLPKLGALSILKTTPCKWQCLPQGNSVRGEKSSLKTRI